MNKRQYAKKHGFDSYEEMAMAQGPLSHAEYHPPSIEYIVPESKHKYQTDFKIGNVYIECKGFLRGSSDKNKYVHIARSLEAQGCKLVFLMDNPEKKMSGAKKRKDGTYLTHRDWLDKSGIPCYAFNEINRLLEDINDS